jgi:hypothetical protein
MNLDANSRAPVCLAISSNWQPFPDSGNPTEFARGLPENREFWGIFIEMGPIHVGVVVASTLAFVSLGKLPRRAVASLLYSNDLGAKNMPRRDMLVTSRAPRPISRGMSILNPHPIDENAPTTTDAGDELPTCWEAAWIDLGGEG